MDMRLNKAVSSIVALAMVLIAMVIVLPTPTIAAWQDSATMTFAPAELFPGETYNATYTLDITNTVDITSLKITEVRVKYEWETSTTPDNFVFQGLDIIDSFPHHQVYSRSVQVPADLKKADYRVEATINGLANATEDPVIAIFTGTVKVSDPIRAVATATPTIGFAPQSVDFTVVASGGSNVYSYSWDFGDATPLSTQEDPTHAYVAGGTYTATVTVTDSLGRSSSAQTAPITIAPGITVNITAQPLSGPFPLSVTFNSSVANAASGGLTYAWSFGDGGTSNEIAPTHTYTKAGNYSVTLKVTDSRNRSGTSGPLAIRVTASVTPIARISASVESGQGPLSVDFTSTVEGGTLPYEYLWNFGDGSTSTETNPSHTYTDPGMYVVWLEVTDSASKTNRSTELTITVESDTTMEVVIAASNVTGTVPMTVSFNSTILNGTAPFFYRWSFGDGVNSTQANPTHTYEKAGTYKVTLTVTDSNSNVTIAHVGAGEAKNITIVVTEPEAEALPSWVWIWSATAVIIAAVGAAGFLMMRRQRK